VCVCVWGVAVDFICPNSLGSLCGGRRRYEAFIGFTVTMEVRWRYDTIPLNVFFSLSAYGYVTIFHTMYVMALYGGYARTRYLEKSEKRSVFFCWKAKREKNKREGMSN